MKIPLLLIFLSFGLLSASLSSFVPVYHNSPYTDSGIIQHKQDGLLNEWPSEQFTENKETHIRYAMDNDRSNLYIALVISSPAVQTKIMSQGMKTFVDMKGKHKENKGVEFPVKKDNGSAFNPKMASDVKQVRMIYGQNLLSLKLFGFTGDEPYEQSLESEGSLHINFSWNESDHMLVEYEVPLKMLETDMASLDKKQISLGWKINGVELTAPVTNSGSSRSVLVAVPAGTRPGSNNSSIGTGSRTGGGSNPIRTDVDPVLKEQSFWVKYSFAFR